MFYKKKIDIYSVFVTPNWIITNEQIRKIVVDQGKLNQIKMEQLAHFVTKSFEYNNNRVLDVLNMTTKSLLCDNMKSSDSSDMLSNVDESDIEDDADTVDIDITDMSSNDGSKDKVNHSERRASENNVSAITELPLSLTKKSNKENLRHVTKNWLISDSPKKSYSDGENYVVVGFFFLLILIFYEFIWRIQEMKLDISAGLQKRI